MDAYPLLRNFHIKKAIAKPLKGFLDTGSFSLLGYRILCWNGIKKIKKHSAFVIYIVHVELVVAKPLSKRKGLQVWGAFFFIPKGSQIPESINLLWKFMQQPDTLK